MSEDNIKISIILPCYKVEPYLGDCLKSVYNQDFQNWECIIVDDGSPDNLAEVAQQWVQKDSRFVFYRKKNEGVSKARNFAVERASGDYVYFLDSDDTLYDCQSLQKFCNAVATYPYDIVVGLFCFFFPKKEGGVVTESESIPQTIFLKNQTEVISYLLNRNLWWSAGNKMYRLDFLKENQLLYSGEEVGEDLTFNFKAFFFARSLCHLNEVTYAYISRKQSRSFTHKSKEGREILFRVEEILNFYDSQQNNHINKQELRSFLDWLIRKSLFQSVRVTPPKRYKNIHKKALRLENLLNERIKKEILPKQKPLAGAYKTYLSIVLFRLKKMFFPSSVKDKDILEELFGGGKIT